MVRGSYATCAENSVEAATPLMVVGWEHRQQAVLSVARGMPDGSVSWRLPLALA